MNVNKINKKEICFTYHNNLEVRPGVGERGGGKRDGRE